MKKRGSSKPVSNVHGFAPSGAIRATQVEGVRGKIPAAPAPKKAAVSRPRVESSGFRGVLVGSDNDPNKWRCAVCKHLNDNSEDICATCKDPKKVFKPKPVEPVGKPKPHKQPVQRPKQRRPEVKEESKVRTIADLGPHPENLGKPKVKRKLQQTEEEALKILAHEKPSKIDDMEKMRIKDEMQLMRNPGRFNAMVYSREFGGSLQ
eukprot:TRINITY_DN6018_c0_g7_i2.p2 TRINITY_DN6018_c0_g7~~TRINITY_DN6018_c0_g7_i2.p2  ORF type:complete len:206 (+),score=61.41 TRINITY_DN6018_c0_g7_i2:129-746(+)